MNVKTSDCRSCGAPIVWAVTEQRLRRMPVDAGPVPDGTILLQHFEVGAPPTAHVTTEPERDELRRQAQARGDELRLFKSHFSTCPNADQHRRAA